MNVAFPDQIRANRMRLIGFLAVYSLVTVSVGYLVGLLLEPIFDPLSYEARMAYGIRFPWDLRQVDGLPRPFPFNAVFGVTAAFLVAAFLYYRHLLRHGGAVVLRLVGARPLAEQQFANTVKEMAVASLGQAPQFFVVERPAINAFACRDPDGREVVAVTRGLLDTMDRDEIQAVVAHEVAHLRNGDTRLMTLFVCMSRIMDLVRWVSMTGVQVLIWFARNAMEKGATGGSDGSDVAAPDPPAGPDPLIEERIVGQWRELLKELSSPILLLFTAVVMAVYAAIVALVVGPVCLLFLSPAWITMWLLVILPSGMLLLRLAISRNREFQADATAVRFTRNPRALRSALERMRGRRPRGGIPVSLGPMLIAPLHGGRRLKRLGEFEQMMMDEGALLTRTARDAIWITVRRMSFPKRVVAWITMTVVGGGPLRIGLAVARRVLGWCGTHPSLGERIERLSNMGARGP